MKSLGLVLENLGILLGSYVLAFSVFTLASPALPRWIAIVIAIAACVAYRIGGIIAFCLRDYPFRRTA